MNARPMLIGLCLAAASASAEPVRDAIYQVAPIDALMAGVYDGEFRIGDLKRHGDIGIGTLNGLDGELIAVDGAFFQARGDGTVAAVPDDARTPLATMTWLDRDRVLKAVSADSVEALIDRLDHVLPSSNLFYAVRADGEFEFVKVRSVSRQERPYQPLEEAVRTQAVFDLQSVRGTLIGFRSPPFARGVAVPGYHFHFVTADRSAGGHVLDLRVRDLDVAVDDSDELRLVLPRQGDFSGADLTPDRREALTRVESAPRGRQAGP